ncbi:MAG TPA: hypothetical protein VJU83_08085 [Burkholderiales bacterium]|nr:hypothetical protein [Burkholderiales bacterium]
MSYEDGLLERISALNIATEFLVPNINTGSRPAVAQWLKADLAALEQLRDRMKRDGDQCPGALSALTAIIDAKHSALGRIDTKKKPRPRSEPTKKSDKRRRTARSRTKSLVAPPAL